MSEYTEELILLKRAVTKGRVSRRDFVQIAMLSGLTFSVAELMFARAARAEPRRGGTFKIGISHGATTDSMDPGLYPDQFTGIALWGALSNSLTEIDTNGSAVPDLAESFEPSSGASKWVFRIRKDVQFHNGKTVTAEDVVASLLHHRGETSKSAAKSLLASIKSMKADGPETVVFDLDGGNADFPYILSDPHMPIMPAKDDGTADWESGIRTGAYMLETFEPGVRAALNRNPNYFKPGRGWFDRVECLSIKDVTARTNALVSGDIHYMDRCDLKTLHLLKQKPDIVVAEQTGYGHYVFAMDVTAPPFDNPALRLAVKHSLDREQIVRNVFFGHGTVGNDNPIAPTVKFAVDPQPRHSYDPDKVRSLLRKAGMENIEIKLSVAEAAFTGATDSALLWEQHAKAASLNLKVIREPNDGYWDNVWKKKAFFAGYWSGRPSCDWMFTSAYAAEATWNETSWKNPRFNELLVKARSETDDSKRAAMYAEMQQLVHDDGGLINLVFNSYVDAHAANLGHGDVASNWQSDGMKVAERWWFTS